LLLMSVCDIRIIIFNSQRHSRTCIRNCGT
jgi:hypothetical protein